MEELREITKGRGLKVCVTGHLGFVGSETKRYFEEKGLEVVGYDIMEGNDIRNIEHFKQFCIANQPDRILHLAAIARFSEADADPKLALETNVMGTGNVAAVSGQLGIPVVYSSTGSVYMPISGTPPITEEFKTAGNSIYGCTKLFGEEYIKDQSSIWIILRYSHLYGKDKRYHGLIGGFLNKIETFMKPQLHGGKQSNDFMYVKDVARANYCAVTATPDNWRQVYNIGTGEELTAEAAGKIICDKAGYDGDIEITEARGVDPERFVFSTFKAENMIGFKAEYDFADGLADMFRLIEDEKK